MNDILYKTKYIVHAANHSTVDSKWSKTVFPYPNHRIYYITSGEASLYLTNQFIKLEKGYMYLIPAFLMVETKCKNSLSHYYIHFQHSFDSQWNIFDTYNPKVLVKVENQIETFELFKKIQQNYAKDTIESNLIVQGSLNLLLAPFFHNVKSINTDFNRFSKVIEYIDSHISEDIAIKDLSSILNINTVYFSNIFSQTFGVSPKRFISERKIKLAQLLLINSSLTVKQISEKTGYRDDKYFSKVFKSKTCMTPLEYRCHAIDNSI